MGISMSRCASIGCDNCTSPTSESIRNCPLLKVYRSGETVKYGGIPNFEVAGLNPDHTETFRPQELIVV